MSDAEMIAEAERTREAEVAMHTEVIGWEDYPFDPSEECNFSDFPQEYRAVDMEDRDLYPF